jgi:hypothetical protein
MHFLNWYTAMWSPRLRLPPLSRGARGDRTGHFWEKRYFCDGFPPSDTDRALNTLRYIHGNPKAAKMRSGFFYDFSNYGSYERLTDDGLTQWHPAFLKLGDSLEDCARKYKGFCQRYKPKEKTTPTRCHWGSKLLAGVHLSSAKSSSTLERRKKASGEKPNLSPAPPLPCSPASPGSSMLESGALLRVVSRKRSTFRSRTVGQQNPLRGDRIAITRDGSGIFPLDGSRVTGCQFLGFHGGISSNRFVFHSVAKLPIQVNSF